MSYYITVAGGGQCTVCVGDLHHICAPPLPRAVEAVHAASILLVSGGAGSGQAHRVSPGG